MTILQSISTTLPPMGLRAIIAGSEKAGKTTFACGAPDSLLIPLEIGTGVIRDQAKTPMLTDYQQVLDLLAEIRKSCQARQFPYKTLVWDTGSALEKLIHIYVIRMDGASKNNKSATMEASHGGYGKAYEISNRIFREFLDVCDELAMYAQINTVINCHVFADKVLDPVQGEYHAYDLLLHSPKNAKTYGKREIATQWADIVGYLYQPMLVQRSDKQQVQQAISLSDGRVLSIERTPSNVAGNRYGMKGEIQIPKPPANGWNFFAHALYQATAAADGTGGVDVFNRTKP